MVPPNHVCVNASSIARVLGRVAVLLVLASIGDQATVYLTGHTYMGGLVPLFYVDAEQNIPTAFSTFLLLFAALLLAVITVLNRKKAGSPATPWAVLSFGFVLLAADEAFSIHERLIRPVRWLLRSSGHLGVFYYAWVIPGIAVVLVLALVYWRFLWRLPANTRVNFLVAGTLYIGGAIGVELIGGRFNELHGSHNFTYSMIATVEESLEMAGAIAFIRALLMYIADNYKEVRFEVSRSPGEEEFSNVFELAG